MPESPPRPNTPSTMPALSPTSYPAIWDDIIHHADASTYPALRATCADLHQRINPKLYRHVAVRLAKASDRLDIHLYDPYTHRRVPGLDFNGGDAARALTLARLKAHCVVLDEVMHGEYPILDGLRSPDIAAFLDLERALAGVTTHRHYGNTYPSSVFALPSAARLVAFVEPKVNTTFYVPLPVADSEFASIFQAFPGPAARVVVLNFPLNGIAVRAHYLSRVDNLSSVFVIVRPDGSPPEAHPPQNTFGVLSGLLLSVEDLLPQVNFAFLGLEDVPDAWVSNDPLPAEWDERRHAIRSMIAFTVRRFQAIYAEEDFDDWSNRMVAGDEEANDQMRALLGAITVDTVASLRVRGGDELYRRFTVPPERSSAGEGQHIPLG